jgi:K+-sensing histidine kinase KdpD
MIHLLYVDDEPDQQDLAKKILARSGGIHIDTAPSAETALAMMEREHYDAIVSDFPLPDRDSIAFLRQIRSGQEGIAIILFTGKGHEEVVIEALNNGADFTVQKSGETEARFTELQHRIHQAVLGRMAENELMRKNKKITLLCKISRHGIANHLTVLRGKIKQTKKILKDPVLVSHVNKMEEAAKEIYNQLRIARMYQDIGENNPGWCRLRDILEQVVTRAGAAGIRCSVEVNGLEIYADPLIPQVFFNLLDNTLRHGMHVKTLTISCHRTDTGMKVRWEDDGVGIPVEEKERIFDEGYGKNTGLGLFLCSEILAITGITLQENGIPDRGARFELLVPDGKYRYCGEPWRLSAGMIQGSQLQSEK